MTSRSGRSYLPIAVAIVVAAAMLSSTAVSLAPSLNTTVTSMRVTTDSVTVTQTTTVTATTQILVVQGQPSLNATGPGSVLALRLALSVSSNNISQGEGVAVGLTLFNTLAVRNNLTLQRRNAPSIDPCSQLPLGISIYHGRYELDNLSTAKALALYNPGAYSCGPGASVSYLSFAPLSANVTFAGPTSGTSNQTGRAAKDLWTAKASSVARYWGHWTGSPAASLLPPSTSSPLPVTNATFHVFEPGPYTVAGEDNWGQVTVSHFNVVSAKLAMDCASLTTNQSFVRLTNFTSGSGPLRLVAYYQERDSTNTFVFAFANTRASNLTMTFLSSGNAGLIFSPDPKQVQAWQGYGADGSLTYPAVFAPNSCDVLRAVLPSAGPGPIPLSLAFNDDEAQTLFLNP